MTAWFYTYLLNRRQALLSEISVLERRPASGDTDEESFFTKRRQTALMELGEVEIIMGVGRSYPPKRKRDPRDQPPDNRAGMPV